MNENTSKEDLVAQSEEKFPSKKGKRTGARLSSLESITAEAEHILKGFVKHDDVPEGRRVTRSCNRKLISVSPPAKKFRSNTGEIHFEMSTIVEVEENTNMEDKPEDNKANEEEKQKDTNGSLDLDGSKQLSSLTQDEGVGSANIDNASKDSVDNISEHDVVSTDDKVTHDDSSADNNEVGHSIPAGVFSAAHDDVPAEDDDKGKRDNAPAEEDDDEHVGLDNVPLDNNNTVSEALPGEGDELPAGNDIVGYYDQILSGIQADNNNDGLYGLQGEDGYNGRNDVEGTGNGNISLNDNFGVGPGPGVPKAKDSVTD